MKYREEVLAKVFTGITVLVMLGIVIFEAWLLQAREKQYEELSAQAGETEDSLQRMTEQNASLEARTAELAAFREEWEPYTGYLGNEEIEKMSVNLFSRTGLIPGEAQTAFAEWIRRQEQLKEEAAGGFGPEGSQDAPEEETDGGQTEEAGGQKEKGQSEAETSKGTQEKSQEKPQEESQENLQEESLPSLWLSYKSPEGERLFLPVNTGSDGGSCVVYTAVYERMTGARMELLFGIRCSGRTGIERDENGRIAWKCLAYRLPDGPWQGIGEEAEPENAQEEEER